MYSCTTTFWFTARVRAWQTAMQALKLLRRKALETAIGGSNADCVFWRKNGYNQPESFHDLSCSTADNTPFDFGGLKGKVVICVNVASL